MTTTDSTTHAHNTACPLDCPDSCSLEVLVESTADGDRLVAIEGTHRNPLTAGFICSKVRRIARHVHGEHRLLHPERRVGTKGAGRFERISWDEALDLAAAKLREARDTYGAESILPLCYGGSNGLLTQDTADARLFWRLGASRLARTVCAAPTGRAAMGLYGKMAGVALEDYEHARLIVLWGVNPSATGIHLVPVIQRALERGAQLVVVDPRRTPLAKQAHLHLQPRPGTDLPLALAVHRELFRRDATNRAFLELHAHHADELERRAKEWSIERAATESGVPASHLERFVDLYAAANPAVIRCGWGVERNRNGGSAVAAILALPAVAGKFGVRGGGYTLSNSGVWKLRSAAGATPPTTTREVNMNQVGRVLTGEHAPGPPVQALFVYNCNPLATLPNQELMRRGLEREDLFTVVFDAVRTDTARYADLLLPATTFLEHRDLAKGYGAMLIHRVEPVLAPAGESRSNVAVFTDLVARLGLARPEDARDDTTLEREILGDNGLLAALDADGVARPTTGARPVQFVDAFPQTPDRKIDLCPETLDREAPLGLYGYQPDPATGGFPLALISPATSKTISSTFGQLERGIVRVAMHPDDARARGISGSPTERVRVWSDLGEVRCGVRLDADLRPGVVFLPKGLWLHRTENDATANALAPDHLADLGGGACFNDARVEVERTPA
ncbi:MAG TPA: molybdopterin-dependent oxidoreductase [Thermoanaerobaculia bacterium]|nr:molybdopterin-dependent oxidoreductase [Thermoanaerobaculia bacterium]